jgi:hypothetical protein
VQGCIGRHKKAASGAAFRKYLGAGNETRTRDLNLGKVALYQLSYSRTFRQKLFKNVFSEALKYSLSIPVVQVFCFQKFKPERQLTPCRPTESRPSTYFNATL